jgi:hypothetical protein
MPLKLTFYNHYGYGDLFESREFVRDWMRLAGAETADYAHRECPNFFEDMPGLRSIAMRPEFNMRAAVTRRDGELWVNTWIGARNAATNPTGDYVIWPGVGCTVENLWRMHNDYLREARLPPLPRSIAEYLPSIDCAKVRIAPALADFITRAGVGALGRVVLVCNGSTGSGHASNFCMGEMVDLLVPCSGVTFVLTERHPVLAGRPGVFFTDDLTDRRPPETDLNAISYLSRFCRVIVGRCSGAQMPTQVIENWMDGTKTQVCFTAHRNGACFVLDPAALGLKMRVHWAAPQSPEEGATELLSVLQGP